MGQFFQRPITVLAMAEKVIIDEPDRECNDCGWRGYDEKLVLDDEGDKRCPECRSYDIEKLD